MIVRVFWIVGAIVVASLAGASPASAALTLCNQTSYIIYAAVGSATRKELDTSGWTRIVPGRCESPIAERLTAPAYFVYAHTSRAHSGPSRAWGGKVPICARDTDFTQRTKLPVHGCSGEDFYKMPFALIDRHGLTAWTTTFRESPDIRMPADAKRAGINRLLEDLGYHVNVPGDRARDLALEDFHKRAKLPADANDAELFASLETEAMKVTAPAGYSVCNETDEPVWAALALTGAKGFVTRGWWEVTAGACSRLITEPLKTDRVFLLAEHRGKHMLVTGPQKLCVADGQFQVSGQGPCRKGMSQIGFAVTDTKGRSGYVAHVSDDGLRPPAAPPHKAGTSK
jgi:uncharacterized membrane protein